jgi:ATP-dependent Clp protease protease subunit
MMMDDFVELNIYAKLANKRILALNQQIDTEIASKIAANLIYLELESKEKEITLIINSTGGVVDGGLFTIYDAIQSISCPVKTICIGEAYSAAAVILSAGSAGLRFAYPHSKVMIHSVHQEEMIGNSDEIKQEIKVVKSLNQIMMEILARHTKNKLQKIKRDCKKDKYMSAQEALKYGLIDHIIEPEKNIFELLLE